MFKDHQYELRNSPATQQYGLILSIVHIILASSWLSPTTGLQKMLSSQDLLCWPIFSPCNSAEFLSVAQTQSALWVYLALAGISFLLLLSHHLSIFGLGFLFVSTTLASVLYLQDYQLHSPVILALIILSMIYIFVPLKTETTKNALVLLFITFGLAKLNLGWLESNKLSGLLQLPPVAAKSVSYTLALLETILPLFLLFRGRIFISSLTVLIIYNLAGVFVFDFCLGIIKIILLFIFFIYSVESKKLAENRLHFSFERPLPSKIWTPISLFFIAIALFTDFSMKSGHTSPFSFFKRVSYKSCSVIAFTNKDNTFKEVDIPTNTSSNCDPYVVEFHLNKVCEKISSNTEHQFYIEFTDLANKVKRRYYKNYCKDMKIDI